VETRVASECAEFDRRIELAEREEDVERAGDGTDLISPGRFSSRSDVLRRAHAAEGRSAI
jgi:hypothetical protein